MYLFGDLNVFRGWRGWFGGSPMLGNVQTHGLLYSPYNPIDHHHMSHLFLHGVHLSIFTPHIISIINIQFSQIYHNHMNNNNTHRIHGAAIYGNMDPINIPQIVSIYASTMDPSWDNNHMPISHTPTRWSFVFSQRKVTWRVTRERRSAERHRQLRQEFGHLQREDQRGRKS